MTPSQSASTGITQIRRTFPGSVWLLVSSHQCLISSPFEWNCTGCKWLLFFAVLTVQGSSTRLFFDQGCKQFLFKHKRQFDFLVTVVWITRRLLYLIKVLILHAILNAVLWTKIKVIFKDVKHNNWNIVFYFLSTCISIKLHHYLSSQQLQIQFLLVCWFGCDIQIQTQFCANGIKIWTSLVLCLWFYHTWLRSVFPFCQQCQLSFCDHFILSCCVFGR